MADAPKEIRLSECETLIKQIRDVTSVSIVLSEDKQIEEVHVLAEDTRNAKQIVRDIETLLRIEYGLDLDHKKISIVQLNKDQRVFQSNRVRFTGIHYSLQGTRLEAIVELTTPKRSCQGKSCGTNTRSNRLKLFAEATVQALSELVETGSSVLLEDVVQYPLGNQSLVSIALTYIHGPVEEYLVGSALIKHDEKEAVVRATLCAINRRVPVDI